MSDLEERNHKAVMQALRQQDEKLSNFEKRISDMAIQNQMMQAELNALRQKNMKDLVAQMGSGPTAAVQ